MARLTNIFMFYNFLHLVKYLPKNGAYVYLLIDNDAQVGVGETLSEGKHAKTFPPNLFWSQVEPL